MRYLIFEMIVWSLSHNKNPGTGAGVFNKESVLLLYFVFDLTEEFLKELGARLLFVHV